MYVYAIQQRNKLPEPYFITAQPTSTTVYKFSLLIYRPRKDGSLSLSKNLNLELPTRLCMSERMDTATPDSLTATPSDT